MNRSGHKRSVMIYIMAFLLPIAVMTIVLIIEKAIPFGNASFLYADAHHQYFSILSELIRWIQNPDKGFVLWDRGLGVDFYANMLYYCMSPFNIILVILGESRLEFSMTLLIILKMSCLGLSSVHFFMKTSSFGAEEKNEEIRPFIALGAAMAFVFSGYVLAYNQNIMWLDCMILMPLLALSIEKIAKEGKWKGYLLLLSAVIIVNFYFAIYVCLFAVCYFLLQEYRGKFLKRFLQFVGTSVLAAMIAGIVIVPAFMAILNRGTYDNSYSEALIQEFGNLWDFVESFNPLSELDGMGSTIYNANNYCGALVMLSLGLYFTEPKIKTCEKVKYGIAIIILTIAANVKKINYIFHAFSFPHGIGNRFVFVLLFLLIFITANLLYTMNKISLKRAVYVSLILVAYIVIGMMFNSRASYLWMLIVSIVYCMIVVLYARESITLYCTRTMLVFFWIAELTVNCFFTAPTKYMEQTYKDEVAYNRYYHVYNQIKTELGERKTSFSNNSFMCASNTDWYSSVLNSSAIDSFRMLGLSNYQYAIMTYRGTTPITALLYNVRYVLTNEVGLHGGYHDTGNRYNINREDSSIELTLYEQDNKMGLGYMVSRDILKWKGDKSAFENQNDFMTLSTADYNVEKPFKKAELTLVGNEALLMEVIDQTDHSYEYIATETLPPIMCLKYCANEDMDLYMWNYDSKCRTALAQVDGEERVVGKSSDSSQTIHIGEVKKGQIIDIYIISGAEKGTRGYDEFNIYSFDANLFMKMLPRLQDEMMQVESISGNSLSAKISAKESGILYLGLPYSDGYIVKVDGKRTPTIKIGVGLMGVEMDAGEHNVCISYIPPGIYLGLICSLSGLSLLLIFLLFARRKAVL